MWGGVINHRWGLVIVIVIVIVWKRNLVSLESSFGAFRKQFPANLGTVFLQLNATNNSTGARSLRTPRNSGGDYPTQASLLEQVPCGQGVGGLACWFQILVGSKLGDGGGGGRGKW